MIEVSHLTKRYGTHTAIADLSFHIEKGQIYGLLGPNGAGKSTTMNIMTGCLSASSGSVTVGGHDIFEEAGPAKRLLGYLPERPPLYLDRTPWEYLSFVGQAKGVAKEDLEGQIHHVMEVTRIADVSQRLIKNLSKGYQQRVGIAQALLGDPEVVILDEPTVGLDPKQIIEIRSLIRDLGHDHTVILSSHILSEVQAVCQTILILSHGKLVACDTPAGLEKRFAGGAAVELVAEAGAEEVCRILTPLDHILNLDVHPREDGACAVTLETDQPPEDLCRALFFAFSSAQRPLLHMAATRAFRVGGYSVAAAAIVVFLAVVANILVNALPASVTQLDTTAGTLYTLSQETEDILDGLEQDVTIYWIVQSGQEDETLGTLLDRYAARSDYVTLETIDPDVSPNFLQEYVSGTVYNNSLIVESGDRNTYVSYEDIYEYSYSSDYSSYDVSFAGESSLTSAIDYVLSDTLPKLYTLTGHGEDDLSTSFQSAVEQQNIEVADLSLLTEESVPEDADCLLINGPDSDLSQDEVEAIQAYLDTGGDLIVLTDPAQDGQDLTNLEALMGEYGMTANDGVVIEGDTANYALGSPFYLLPNLESHSITSPLQEGGYYILLALAQGITVEESPRDGLTVESLLTTSDAAYSKIAGYSMETYSKEEGDIDGPFSLAAIATDTLEDGSESHVIWVGSTSLLDDQYNQQVSGANQDFFLNCVGWTCEGEEGVSIHAKQITTEYLTMSASTASMLTLLLVAVLPAGYLLFGLRIWIRRKHQ